MCHSPALQMYIPGQRSRWRLLCLRLFLPVAILQLVHQPNQDCRYSVIYYCQRTEHHLLQHAHHQHDTSERPTVHIHHTHTHTQKTKAHITTLSAEFISAFSQEHRWASVNTGELLWTQVSFSEHRNSFSLSGLCLAVTQEESEVEWWWTEHTHTLMCLACSIHLKFGPEM